MRWVVIASFGLAACGGGSGSGPVDSSPGDGGDAAPDANPADVLDSSGLCLDSACTMISPEVRAYTPRYELWADTATKRRWVKLPPGTQIDTTDPDHWVFPVGTKFWKEFTRDDVRVETRLIEKRLADEDDPSAWTYVSYAWNAEQTLATRAPSSGVVDANGTGHDIPATFNCRNCHEVVRPGRIVGFQAMSLDFDAPADGLDLDDLIAMGLLTENPPGAAAPHYPLPGTATDQAAFGYLHANCGHCHNPSSTVIDNTPLELRLLTTKLANVNVVPAYATSVDVTAARPFNEGGVQYDKIIVSGDPAMSGLIVRMSSTQPGRRMPATGSEITDPAGQTALLAWIDSL